MRRCILLALALASCNGAQQDSPTRLCVSDAQREWIIACIRAGTSAEQDGRMIVNECAEQAENLFDRICLPEEPAS